MLRVGQERNQPLKEHSTPQKLEHWVCVSHFSFPLKAKAQRCNGLSLLHCESLGTAASLSALCSQRPPGIWSMQGPVRAESSETETSPLGSNPKNKHWMHVPTLPFSKQKLGIGVFSCSLYTKPRKVAKVSERLLVQTTAFVLGDLKTGAPSWPCLDSGKIQASPLGSSLRSLSVRCVSQVCSSPLQGDVRSWAFPPCVPHVLGKDSGVSSTNILPADCAVWSTGAV